MTPHIETGFDPHHPAQKHFRDLGRDALAARLGRAGCSAQREAQAKRGQSALGRPRAADMGARAAHFLRIDRGEKA